MFHPPDAEICIGEILLRHQNNSKLPFNSKTRMKHNMKGAELNCKEQNTIKLCEHLQRISY